ncbi:MAG: AbrB/MazE/SpoVT family DNA-binding domain-containing protein [Thermoprotei archaeon]|nr:AbrB/MazE/SpoVT family DNA-binding domain-containing protein [Thermoprotei archaeon]
MAAVEVRRVQRLGSSSLIVTLPHSWAKSVGLKAGDSVIIASEGRTLRITPITKSVGDDEEVSLDLRKYREPRIMSLALPCLYILGYNSVELKLPGELPKMAVKRLASKLIGVDVAEEGEGVVTAKILVDHGRVNVRFSIKELTNLTLKQFRLLASTVREGYSSGLEVELRELNDEIYRIRSLVDRYLHIYHRSPVTHQNLNIPLAISILVLLSLVNSIIQDTIEVTSKLNAKPDHQLASHLDDLASVVPVIGSLAFSPSVKRALETLEKAEGVKKALETLIAGEALDKAGVVVASKTLDIIKIIQIIAYAVLCVGLLDGVKDVKA